MKYELNQKVYYPVIEGRAHTLDCPDCLNTGKWKVTTPGGEILEMNCPRCTDIHNRHSLIVEKFDPSVEMLTVGQRKVQEQLGEEDKVTYMCKETGVGSGSVYREELLYSNHAEAMLAAKEMAKEAYKKSGDRNRQRKRAKPSELFLRHTQSENEKELTTKLKKLIKLVEENVPDTFTEDLWREYYG